MMEDPRKRSEKERQNPSKPIDQSEREPYREPKRPFDPQIDREIHPGQLDREIERERLFP